MKHTRLASLWSFLLVAACTANPAPAPGPASSPPATPGAAPQIPVPTAYRNAVERGTRSALGAPGARYWQQRVRYRIDADLDPQSALLTGRERIVYYNRSPQPLATVVLNLYQNIFTRDAPTNRNPPNTGGVTLTRVAAQGTVLQPLPAERIGVLQPVAGAPVGYAVENTLARLVLARPIAPGDSAVLEVEWYHRVPPKGAFRTAYEDTLGGRVLQVAQWYPQIATFDDVDGWDATPYLGDGEFYLEYGDFDVALTLPAGWLVGATGELRNPEQVLTPTARQSLDRALAADGAVNVVTAADLRAGRATQPGPLTWRFRAENVRDFAFATSDRYVWDAARVLIPAATAGPERAVLVHSLYRPGSPGWERAARYGEHATEFFSRLLVPYAYPQITVSEGPIYGMEYPMLVFIARPEKAVDLYSVIAHEIGHQWFPMMAGENEAAYAWMDEGFTTFHEDLAHEDFFPADNPFLTTQASYLRIAGKPNEVPLMLHTDSVGARNRTARVIAAYSKPGTLMRSLRAVIGEDSYRRVMRTYASEWLFKHPSPWDFFRTAERVAGRDLGWFFAPWWFGTGILDQAIAEVAPAGMDSIRVTVRDLGQNPVPTRIVVTGTGGTTRAEIPMEMWLGGARTATVAVPVRGTATRVELDPEQWFPDVDRANNAWNAPGR